MLRGGLRHLIGAESRYEVCGEASSAAEAIERIPAIKPDLVVMYITLTDRLTSTVYTSNVLAVP